MEIAKLYPEIQFPVSRGTPMISPNIKWNHEDIYLVPHFDTQSYYERRKMIINLNDKSFEFIKGHIIDGRILFPATGWIFLVWETFAMINGMPHEELPVIFENVKFLRATTLQMNQDVFVSINTQRGTGRFEILEGSTAIATGIIRSEANVEMTEVAEPDDDETALTITKKEFFKEMRIR